MKKSSSAAPKFDKDALEEVKKKCVQNCLSTCFYTMGHYYRISEVPKWILKHVRDGNVR